MIRENITKQLLIKKKTDFDEERLTQLRKQLGLFSVALCKNNCGSSAEYDRKGERDAHVEREDVCVCMPVCYQLTRTVTSRLKFWTKFSGFTSLVSHHCLWPWLLSDDTSVLKFSYLSYG